MYSLIPQHGGFRKLKTFQLARLIYDITVRFCKRFIPLSSRTHDQMVQAARSGVQNIAEGSQASGTSKKTEIKLTNVARASLEELKLDFEDFLRQRLLFTWPHDEALRCELTKQRFSSADQFALWAKNVATKTDRDIAEIAANGVIVLIQVTCTLLDRQLQAQANAFQNEGGITERLYKHRVTARKDLG